MTPAELWQTVILGVTGFFVAAYKTWTTVILKGVAKFQKEEHEPRSTYEEF